MKITKDQLRKIIKETIKEESVPPAGAADKTGYNTDAYAIQRFVGLFPLGNRIEAEKELTNFLKFLRKNMGSRFVALLNDYMENLE